MAAETTENVLFVGAGFLIIACVFFLLFGMVFAVDVPTVDEYYAPLTRISSGEIAQPPVNGTGQVSISDYSWLWIALLALSVIVMGIGAKLVYKSSVEK
jgi:hypothetical protein|tara:strand:+ start:120 stop:416 length:297 start_codon:yes stop_codon:yes gene_type:complete